MTTTTERHETGPATTDTTAQVNPDAAISVRGLRRAYGSGKTSFDAVRGIDLDVRPGTLFALLGTNGAGKTSTLEVLEGLAPATAGTVRVLGHDPYSERSSVRHRTGTMLQEAGFPDELTVGEMATMWAATLTHARSVTEALAAVDLTHRAGVRVASLSGGEKRRLDLALATMNNPELLFLDEPTTGLDPESRRRSWDIVRGMLDAGTTVVLTTHYLEEAEELADDIAIMHQGRIAVHGTLAQIVADEPARISFLTPRTATDRFAEGLAALPGLVAPVRADHTRTELEARDVQETTHALLDLAATTGTRLDGLSANAASLEQVFLRIAGGLPSGSDA